MKIYLAGPMRGYSEFNFPTFHAAAARLREVGHTVFSPAERDIERHGDDVCKSETGDLADIAKTGFDLREALAADIAWICAEADAVALLNGWERSKGVKAEKATAEALGLKTGPWEQFL